LGLIVVIVVMTVVSVSTVERIVVGDIVVVVDLRIAGKRVWWGGLGRILVLVRLAMRVVGCEYEVVTASLLDVFLWCCGFSLELCVLQYL